MQIERITHNPAVMGGKPCIRGLRVTVSTILGLLARGKSRERILQAYPYLEPEDLDAVLVWVGQYNQARRWMTAAEAVAEFMRAEDPRGWEVVIPRRIEACEVHRIRSLPQVIGWRFHPGAKGKPPFCTCRFCTRG